MSSATQSVPTTAPARWHQFVVMALGLALVAMTAVAVYLAARSPEVTPAPAGDSETAFHDRLPTESCYQPQVAC